MKRTSFFLDEGMDRELHLLAQQEKVPVAALVRDALGRYLDDARRGRGLRLRFLAARHTSPAVAHTGGFTLKVHPEGTPVPRGSDDVAQGSSFKPCGSSRNPCPALRSCAMD